uniref:Protein kinase domain-containing protein n=1 Tax=Angiostrongylus cantonensis TaxID=6313 RepID=A0A0K0DN72_ANGCA
MEAAWVKRNYGDDLYLQCTYTRIRVLDRGLAHTVRYVVIGLAETRRRHPFNAVDDTQCWRSRQHEFVHEHRFIRATNNSNRAFTIKKMLINTGFDNLRRLRADIKL